MGITASAPKEVNMDSEVAQMVKEKIDKHCIMIFSKTWCPYCKSAKQAFDELKKQYEVYELDKNAKSDEIQDVLHELTGARSVPRVFVNGKCIGGGTETNNMLKSGELQKLVENCR